MTLKSRKGDLKQRVKVSLPNMFSCFTIIVAAVLDLIWQTQNYIFL